MPPNPTPNAPSDEQCVGRALRGDKDSFGALVDRYWGMAVALALGQISDRHQAEDVAQESFIQAYRHLRKLRDRSRFAGWLSRIVRQKSVDHLRRRSREERTDVRAVVAAAPEGNPGLSAEQQEFVQSAVRRLPEKSRGIVIMRFVGNMSAPQIARQLGMRAGAVRVRLHRAYKELRKDLASLAEEARAL